MRTLCGFLVLGGLMWGSERLPEDRGAAGLWQSLKRLQTPVKVLYVTAHPDDEDPALLTYLSRGLGARVTMLILNRGEGGANVVSGDFFEALGALRTVEMLQAAKHYGVEVRFTRAVDYGFSKNIGEAFRAWRQEELLADMVAIAREVRPEIIISRFNDSERDGHGHHQAAGRLAKLLFRTVGTGDWKPVKLYTTNWREGEAVTLKIDTGAYDPVLGRSYAQIGREGYRWHKSQGMASNVARPGPVFAYLKRENFEGEEKSLLEGLALGKRDENVAAAVAAFDALHPEKCAPHLAKALLAKPGDSELSSALALALGLELEALVEPENAPTGPFAMFRPVETIQVAQPGQAFRVRLVLHQRGVERVEGVRYFVNGLLSEALTEVKTPLDAKATTAAWQRASVLDSMYTLREASALGKALPDAPVVGAVEFQYRGAAGRLRAPVESTMGAVRQVLAVGPTLSVKFDSDFGYLPVGKDVYEVGLTVKNFSAKSSEGEVVLELPAGFSSVAAQKFRLGKTGEEARLKFVVRVPAGVAAGDIVLKAVARAGGQTYRDSFEAVTQPGLSVAYLGKAAIHRVRAVDVKFVSGLRVGYVMGPGDEVPDGLRQLGLAVDMLDAGAVATGDLSKYDTILVGIRAYAVREDLRTHNQRLLDFAAKGGTVVVQYQTQEYDKNFGPLPYTQGRGAEEVSEENAPVILLAPDHRVFQFPNRIQAADFEGWVEQRGSKFFTTWDAGWTPLVETHDTGQAPQSGVCLAAPVGKGNYVYCALAFYRQLPFGVPGAARLLANLVSLGRN